MNLPGLVYLAPGVHLMSSSRAGLIIRFLKNGMNYKRGIWEPKKFGKLSLGMRDITKSATTGGFEDYLESFGTWVALGR